MSLDDFIDVALGANRTVGIYPGNANRTCDDDILMSLYMLSVTPKNITCYIFYQDTVLFCFWVSGFFHLYIDLTEGLRFRILKIK
jgi:hypothetical protein